MSLILYAVGVIGLLLTAAAGVWRAYWLCAALIVGPILFVWIYPSVAPLNAHGTGNYMDVWGMLIVAPWLLGGGLVAGCLSYVIMAFTARRREEAEIAALVAKEEGQ